jgi:outer membrane lipoprotein SlyB
MTMINPRIVGNEVVTEDSAARTTDKTYVTRNPEHRDEEAGGAVTGAVGAVVGGPIGAVIGGAVGATTGATIGAVDSRNKDEVDKVVVTKEERRP